MLRTPSSWLTRVSKGFFRRERTMFVALLVIATAIRLPPMFFPGYWHDLGSYVNWGTELVSNGFSNLYAVGASTATFPGASTPGGAILAAINYPPGTPYLFGVVVLLYNHTVAPITLAPLTALVNQNGIGPFIAKLPLLVADLATIMLLYHEARKRRSQRFAWLAAASFAFSPAVLYDGVVWGQTDALVALPVLLALFAILSKRYALGGVSLALAALIKPQPVIFIPLVLLYLWRWTRREDFIRFTAALLGTALLALLPLMVPRFQLFDMLYNMRAMSLSDNFVVTQDAFNFWWLTGLHAHRLGSTLLGVKIAFVADALFGVVMLVIGVQMWRREHPAYLCFGLALEVFGFFMFMGGQLERYLFLFIPLMLATLIVSERKSSDRLMALYVAGTALCLLNMLVSIGAALAGVSPMIPYVTSQSLSAFIVTYFGDISFAIAAYLLATFAYAMHTYLAGRFAPLTASPRGQPSAQEAIRASVSNRQLSHGR